MKGKNKIVLSSGPSQAGPVYPPEYLAQYQPVRIPPRSRLQPRGCCSCFLTLLIPVIALMILAVIYFLAPPRANVLVLGIDRVPDGTALGRSDTMILVSIDPLRSSLKMLSIPRDLWVKIPGIGENRINTAHFYAEAERPGSGPAAAARVVQDNFAVPVPYFMRVRFDAFLLVVDALGGVDVNLPRDMASLPAGPHHLDGQQALAFARDRKGTDDFFRMENTLFLIKAIAGQALSPASWPRLPAVLGAVASSVDTNLPAWQLPRLGFTVIRAYISGRIDSRTIQREMTVPTVTSGGADVLMPRWELIHPYMQDWFSR